MRGVPKIALRTQADPATGIFGRTPYGARATILVRGVPKLGFGGPSVELPVGHAGPGTGTFGKAPYGVCREEVEELTTVLPQNPPKGVGS